MSSLTTPIQYRTRSCSQCNKSIERKKRHTDLKRRNKTLFTETNHLHRKFQRIYKKLLELINEFSKVEGYKSQLHFYMLARHNWNSILIKTLQFTAGINNKICAVFVC